MRLNNWNQNMNNIQYNFYTPSNVVVAGALFAIQIAPVMANQPTPHQEVNRLYFLSDSSSTFNNYENFVRDPYLKFMTRVDLTPTNNIIKPKTELGRKLLEYRKVALAKGMRTLSVDEIDAMISEGRGLSTT